MRLDGKDGKQAPHPLHAEAPAEILQKPQGRHWVECSARARFAAQIALLVSAAFPALAQQRFDVTPLFGYRSTVSFPITAANGEARGTARLSSSGSFGVAAGFRYDEYNVIEFRYTRETTQMRLQGSPVPAGVPALDTTLEQYHGDFTREYIPQNPHYQMWRPFIIGSVGMTRISAAGQSYNRASFGLGAGVKFFTRRWLGLRAQAQWLPIWITPEIKAFACGGGCVVAIGGRFANQGEVSFGPVFSF